MEQNRIDEVDKGYEFADSANKFDNLHRTSSDLATLGHLPQRGRLNNNLLSGYSSGGSGKVCIATGELRIVCRHCRQFVERLQFGRVREGVHCDRGVTHCLPALPATDEISGHRCENHQKREKIFEHFANAKMVGKCWTLRRKFDIIYDEIRCGYFVRLYQKLQEEKT